MMDNMKVSIVMYHYVRDLKRNRYPQIKGLDIREFKEQISWLNKNYNIVRVEDIIAAYDCGEKLPDKAMLLTFDDGYVDNYTYCFPLLDELNLQGVFYISGKSMAERKLLDVNKIHFVLASAKVRDLIQDVASELEIYSKEQNIPSFDELYKRYAVPSRWDDKETVFLKRILQTGLPEAVRNHITSNLFKRWVGVDEETFANELYLDIEQIKCMKRHGMHIGLHGYEHYWMGNMELKEMQEDVQKSLRVLEDVINPTSWILNYPYGSYNDSVVEYIKSLGCTLAMTTEVGVADIGHHSRYMLPRLNTNDFPPKGENYILLK